MAIDASAVARVLGIEPVFKDLRAGSVLFLPQRIAVIAQGATASSFSTTKFTATSSGQVGDTAGYGSPAHLIARQLFPKNGDGIGTIPVDFFLLDDHASGAAAAGHITPSGTQTEAGTYYVVVNNIASEAFTVAASASVSSRCVSMHEAISAVLEMPVTPSYTYATPTASADGGNTGNGTCTSLSVTGTPAPGTWTLTCNTTASHGGVFTLTDPDGTEVSDSLTMTGGSGAATVLSAGGLQFTLTDGTTDFAQNDSFTITVAATRIDLTAKWKGTTGNDLVVEVEGEELGTTWTIVQPTGGLTDPTVDAALDQFGNVWYTQVINGMGIGNSTALNTIQTFGDGRWGETVRKPFMSWVGVTDATVAAATAVSTTRRTDKINGQLTSPGSNDLPCVVAARGVARIAKVANNNPPQDYGSQRLTGLVPGADGDQWDFTKRDQAIKAGSSTVEVKDGVVCLSDVVTFYRPTGEEPPAYRYAVDIVKLQNIIFNLDLIFSSADWDGAPLIPDDQATVNPTAKKPKMAVAEVAALIDSLALNAIISDPKTAKANTSASINAQNPKRLDVSTTLQLSGNTNIKGVTLNFGFYYGNAA